MPMCQSPKIADVFLRAGKVPANDNCAPAQEGIESFDRDNAFKAARQTFLIFFGVIVPLLLNQLVRFIMSEALGMRSKNQKSPEA
jgi:hypothetical protein